MRYIIGNGTTTEMWTDPWLKVHPPRPLRAKSTTPPNVKVSEYLSENRWGWNLRKLREDVEEEDISRILIQKISDKAEQDLMGWHYNDNGLYSVKS